MKLGAQLYSVRNHLTTPEDIRKTFRRIREIGYENVQLSGAGPIEATELKDICEETALPIVCTHVSYDRLIGETDALIAEHRIFGCPVIGIGSMPKQFRGSQEGLDAFLESMREPVKRILDAGLSFAYHNHHFEFETDGGEACFFDRMLEACPDWQWILDVYWLRFANRDPLSYIAKIGRNALPNIHFKDMAKDSERSICCCGDGITDFASLADACRAHGGVENILVEQDTAAKMPDAFSEMQKSFTHLRPIIF